VADDGTYNLHEAAVITRVALWLTLGVTLDALGTGWLGILCVLGLAAAIDYQARWDGQRLGTMQGIANYISMTEHEQNKIRKLVEKWQKLN